MVKKKTETRGRRTLPENEKKIPHGITFRAGEWDNIGRVAKLVDMRKNDFCRQAILDAVEDALAAAKKGAKK